jgi:thiamine biosynthesis protein ThiC
MPTQLQHARNGEITPSMRRVADRENRKPEFVREQVAEGKAVIPNNHAHDRLDPMIIGRAFATKVNANIGNSETTSGLEEELEKLHTAVHYGADTVMDLSTGDSLDEIRTANVAHSPVPFGTVPIYEAVTRVDDVAELTPELLVDVIEKQAEQAVDYMTIHAGVLAEHLPLTDGRTTGIVSRGGSILAQWMEEHGEQNPLFTRFEDICEIFAQHDVTFSLGDGLRPGSLADASDDALSEARYAFDWQRQLDLAVDPERAQSYHDQTLPGDNYKQARFCSMCGVEFCSMRIDQDARDADSEMEHIDGETDLESSPAAEVNLPPTGTHDTDALGDMPAPEGTTADDD